jgi:hypothetical protein
VRALTLLCAGTAVAGAALMAASAGPYWERHQSMSWRAVDAEVVDSRVMQQAGEHGLAEWAQVDYRYGVDGTSRTGRVVRFGPVEVDGDTARAIVRRYPRGSVVKAWVDPRDPARAVLDRETVSSRAAWKVMFGLSLLLSGLWALAGLRKREDAGPAAPPA